jgi:DNA-binding MarR family transcriptional regulator
MPADESAQFPSADAAGEFPLAVADYVLMLLTVVCQVRDSALDHALRPLGLNVGRYRVLGALLRFGVCTTSELAKFTAVDRANMARATDHLVAEGWVSREFSPSDRRRVLMALTPLGRKTYLAAVREVIAYNNTMFAGVSDDSVRVTARTLRAAVTNIISDPEMREGLIRYGRDTGAADGGD